MGHSSQLDLFANNQELRPIPSVAGNAGIRHTLWRYERALLVLIVLLVTGITSFCLGVERGKRISRPGASPLRIESRVPVCPPAAVRPQAVGPMPVQPALAQPLQTAGVLIQRSQGYTIQLASYKTRTFAQRIAAGLTAQGFQTMVIPKGVYSIVCVGNFTNRDSASGMLAEFRKKNIYEGCFIRRL